MEVINVVELINGIVSKIDSFVWADEQLRSQVIEEAEDHAYKLAIANGFTGDKEEFLDMGNWEDGNGYEVTIVWSGYVNLQL